MASEGTARRAQEWQLRVHVPDLAKIQEAGGFDHEALFLYLVLLHHANANGAAWPGTDSLQRTARLGASQLREYARKLEDAGLIIRPEARRRVSERNPYFVLDLETAVETARRFSTRDASAPENRRRLEARIDQSAPENRRSLRRKTVAGAPENRRSLRRETGAAPHEHEPENMIQEQIPLNNAAGKPPPPASPDLVPSPAAISNGKNSASGPARTAGGGNKSFAGEEDRLNPNAVLRDPSEAKALGMLLTVWKGRGNQVSPNALREAGEIARQSRGGEEPTAFEVMEALQLLEERTRE